MDTAGRPGGELRRIPTDMTPTLTPFISDYIADRHQSGEISDHTATSLRSLLAGIERAHGHRRLDQFGTATIDRWRRATGHLAPTTQALYLAHVRHFCGWLHRNGHVAHPDPTGHVKLKPLPRRAPVTLTEDEAGRLLDTVKHDPRAHAIVSLMLACGCRCVEIARLDVDDYDPRGGTIRLEGKGGHERVLPVPGAAAKALDRYLDVVGRRSGPLFRNAQAPARRLSNHTISIYVRRWMRAAKIKTAAHDGRSAHGLRRTAGSDVMDRSGDIRIVQEMLGHSQIETTARYYLRRVSMQQMREAMEGRTYDTTTDLGETG